MWWTINSSSSEYCYSYIQDNISLVLFPTESNIGRPFVRKMCPDYVLLSHEAKLCSNNNAFMRAGQFLKAQTGAVWRDGGEGKESNGWRFVAPGALDLLCANQWIITRVFSIYFKCVYLHSLQRLVPFPLPSPCCCMQDLRRRCFWHLFWIKHSWVEDIVWNKNKIQSFQTVIAQACLKIQKCILCCSGTWETCLIGMG